MFDYQNYAFTSDEIRAARHAINFYPDASSFWDTQDGQYMMTIANHYNMEAHTTNMERCRLHAEAMKAALGG